jgi:alanyl-tRNA synthetase
MQNHITPQFLAEKTWDLYQTFGVPIEISEDILQKRGLQLDKQLLQNLIDNHQKMSQISSVGQFKSGLGEDTSKTRQLHTVTHILHQALRDLIGPEVRQMGSAITSDKARFDFSASDKLTDQQLVELTHKVQQVIDMRLSMIRREMSQAEARALGAIGLFGEKYGEKVTVYSLENEQGEVFSREFCGGPHVNNTSEIGRFVILKQKSVGQGIKRLEFTVE